MSIIDRPPYKSGTFKPRGKRFKRKLRHKPARRAVVVGTRHGPKVKWVKRRRRR